MKKYFFRCLFLLGIQIAIGGLILTRANAQNNNAYSPYDATQCLTTLHKEPDNYFDEKHKVEEFISTCTDSILKRRMAKHLTRWTQLYGKRVDDNGSLDLSNRYLEDYFNTLAPECPNGAWKSQGPVYSNALMAQGKIVAINAVHDGTDLKVFAGSPSGGLWKGKITPQNGTYDVSWVSISDQLSYPTIGIWDIAIAPSNSNYIYVATNFGVLKSTDGGTAWSIAFDASAISTRIKKIIINPSDPNKAVALGRSFTSTSNGNIAASVAVKTDNGFVSTTTTILPHSGGFADAEFDPVNPNIIYATTSYEPWAGNGQPSIWGTILKSTDGGITWGDITSTLPSTWLTNNSGGSIPLSNITANYFAIYTPSIDVVSLSNGDLRIAIGFLGRFSNTPSNPDQLTCCLAVSDNGGSNWTGFSLHNCTNATTNPNNADCYTYGAPFGFIADTPPPLEFSSDNSNDILTGSLMNTNGRLITLNATNSSLYPTSFDYIIGSGISTNAHADHRKLFILSGLNPNDPDYVFMGNDGGLAINTMSNINTPSIALGSWQKITGTTISNAMIVSELYGGAPALSRKEFLISASYDNACAYRLNNSSNWEHFSGGDGIYAGVDWKNDKDIRTNIFTNVNGSLKRYTMGNTSSNGSISLGSGMGIAPIVQNPINPDKMAWVANGKLMSRSFLPSSSLESLLIDACNEHQALKVVNNKGNCRYYISNIRDHWDCANPQQVDPQLYRVDGIGTSLNGAAITNITSGLDLNGPGYGRDVTAIEVSPDNPDWVWVGLSGWDSGTTWAPNISYNGIKKVYFSSDAGLTWTDISQGLPVFPISQITYQRGTMGVLYAGTDVGVFRFNPSNNNPSTGSWVCYKNLLPKTVVNNIYIDYNEKKLVAATYGRGIWETPLPAAGPWTVPNAYHKDDASGLIYTLGKYQDPNFKDVVYVAEDIIVPTGKTLVVRCTLSISKDHYIIVQKGAKLIVDGGMITNIQGDMWGGIRVLGQANLAQTATNQGTVILKNNSVIEYAWNGISTWDGQNITTTGGIITADNSTFKNNRRAVEFMQYENHNASGAVISNVSRFNKCTVSIDNDYRVSQTPFGITLWDVRGITFNACNFIESRSNMLTAQQALNGIYSLDAGYSLKPICTSPLLPCTSYLRGKFTNCNNAVNATYSSNISKIVNVERQDFERCMQAINLTSSRDASVLYNNILVGGHVAPNMNGSSKGIVLDASTGFNVEGNTIQMPNNATDVSIGIWANNTGSESNQIYKNSFSNLMFANLANRQNRNPATNSVIGLDYACNSNSTNKYDFAVLDCNLPNYGVRSRIGLPSTAAGNTFSFNPAFTESDFYNRSANNITYYRYNGNMNEIPTDITTSSPISCGVVFSGTPTNANPNNCPSRVENGKVQLTSSERLVKQMAIATHKSTYNSLKTLYNSLKDGGNTQAMLAEINAAYPSDTWALRQALLEHSPYLSEDVLKEAIEKAQVLPNPILFEIFAANPEEIQKESLLKLLEEKDNPFSPYWIALLRQIAEGGSTRSTLETAMTTEAVAIYEAANSLIDDVLNDSTQFDASYLRTWLGELESIEGDCHIAELYIAEHNMSAAENWLSNIPSWHSLQASDLDNYNNYQQLKMIQINALSGGRSMATLENSEIAVLQELATHENLAAAQAQSILNFFYDGQYAPTPILPSDNGAPKRQLIASAQDNSQSNTLLAQPNPAEDWTLLSWQLDADHTNANLLISDIYGKVLDSQVIKNNNGQYLWDTRNVPQGLYWVSLKSTNHKDLILKVSVVH